MTDFAQIERSIRNFAAARPDFIYESSDEEYGKCTYVDADVTRGDCIVGRACVANGADLYALAAFDAGDGTNGSTVVGELFGIVLTPVQSAWIDSVQRKQDNGFTWAEAVANADTEYPSILA